MEIIKYVYSFDDEKKHWEYCERNKFPFILLKDVYGNYTEIFYDITNFNIDLEHISKEINEIFDSYRKFALIDNYFWENNIIFLFFLLKKDILKL